MLKHAEKPSLEHPVRTHCLLFVAVVPDGSTRSELIKHSVWPPVCTNQDQGCVLLSLHITHSRRHAVSSPFWGAERANTSAAVLYARRTSHFWKYGIYMGREGLPRQLRSFLMGRGCAGIRVNSCFPPFFHVCHLLSIRGHFLDRAKWCLVLGSAEERSSGLISQASSDLCSVS